MSDEPKKAQTTRTLVERLRGTLQAARGNLQVRERLRVMLCNPAQLEALVRELGPNHAIVHELLEITGLNESREARAA